MKKLENRRNLVIFIGFLALVLISCIANIVKLNIFALVIDVIMVIFICFVLGYNYCRYESQECECKAVEETPTEEVAELLPTKNDTLDWGGI